MEAKQVKSHVTSNEQWGKYGMTKEALCYSVCADRVASDTANKRYARVLSERALDGNRVTAYAILGFGFGVNQGGGWGGKGPGAGAGARLGAWESYLLPEMHPTSAYMHPTVS